MEPDTPGNAEAERQPLRDAIEERDRTILRLHQELAAARRGLLSRDARIMALKASQAEHDRDSAAIRDALRHAEQEWQRLSEALAAVEGSRILRLVRRYAALEQRPGLGRLLRATRTGLLRLRPGAHRR